MRVNSKRNARSLTVSPASGSVGRGVTLAACILVALPVARGAGDHPHQHHDDQAHWMAPAEAAKKPNPVSVTAESVARGKQIYDQHCAMCHGAKGEGDGPAGAALKPAPANLKVMAPQHPDGDLAWKIAEGRGAMPGWKSSLSEQDIWNVVNYIKGMSAGTAHGKPDGHPHGGKDHHHK